MNELIKLMDDPKFLEFMRANPYYLLCYARGEITPSDLISTYKTLTHQTVLDKVDRMNKLMSLAKMIM